MSQTSASPRPSRREREKLRHRDEILAAAQDLFAEKGYHNVTMHEIAQRAEYAIGTLYAFFANKEELYRALLLELTEKFEAALGQALDSPGDEAARIARYVRAKGEVFTANPKIMRLYFAELLGASYNLKAGLESEIRQRYDVFLQRLAAIFQGGMARGALVKADPYDLAVSLDSAFNAMLFLWLEDPERHPQPEKADAILELFLSRMTTGG